VWKLLICPAGQINGVRGTVLVGRTGPDAARASGRSGSGGVGGEANADDPGDGLARNALLVAQPDARETGPAAGALPLDGELVGLRPSVVVNRAVELRASGVTLQATADALQAEFEEAAHITKDTLASLLRRQSSVAADAESGLSSSTVKAVHVILHKAFGAAVRWGRLIRNPADLADPPRVGSHSEEIETWSSSTLRSFLAATAEYREHALWVLLATTGTRRGEAVGLRWQDVDLNAGRLSVVHTILSINGKILVSDPKTAKGRRAISLDSSTVAVLRDHRRRMLEDRMLVGADFSDEGLVFHRPDGSCLRPETVSAAFLRRQKKLGLPRLTLKGLRHTWATLALEQGIHPRVVQERLGHSTIAITLGIYSHVSPTLHDQAAEIVSGLIL